MYVIFPPTGCYFFVLLFNPRTTAEKKCCVSEEGSVSVGLWVVREQSQSNLQTFPS